MTEKQSREVRRTLSGMTPEQLEEHISEWYSGDLPGEMSFNIMLGHIVLALRELTDLRQEVIRLKSIQNDPQIAVTDGHF